MARGPARPYPLISLGEALTIPAALRDHNAGRPMNRLLLADALTMSPGSSGFRELVAAAGRYGLTAGNYNSETVSLTPLGEAVVRPESEEQRLNALRQAMEKIPLFARLLEHYNNNRLPGAEIFKGILEKPPFSVPTEWSAEAVQVFMATGRLTGVIRDMSGGAPYVIRDAGPPIPQTPVEESTQDEPEEFSEPLSSKNLLQEEPRRADPPSYQPPPPALPRQFFIAHGRDTEALTQLQSILKGFDIPYVVAAEEPNAGRPISQKVADLMRSCSAGIFIFSADDEVTDADGNSVKRPRPNVIYELGAASFQYGQRIVIFKERGVEFPTDFRDLGYIEYERHNLSAKAMDLLKELINLKAVKVTAGG